MDFTIARNRTEKLDAQRKRYISVLREEQELLTGRKKVLLPCSDFDINSELITNEEKHIFVLGR